MTADLSRLPIGTDSWCALVNHATALGDLSEVGYLELKGKLPFKASADKKRSAVIIARAMLGMANRMPDVAEAHLGGFGVVLVGIDGGEVTGAEQVDGAVLRDALQPYIGDDGPTWENLFIPHPDGLVLAVVVHPPKWGDRTHACRKDYSPASGGPTVRDGEVFVRVPGSQTRPATSSDLADLERRRDRSPSTGAAVNVDYSSTFDRVDDRSIGELINEPIQRKVDELIAGLDALPDRSQTGRSQLGAAYSILMASERVNPPDRRSRDEFKAAVNAWAVESRDLVDVVTNEFYVYQLRRGQWAIHNESDQFLDSVRVELLLPANVRVLAESDAEFDLDEEHFDPFELWPEPPKPWGTLRPHGMDTFLRPAIPPIPRIAENRPPEFEVEATLLGTRVTWNVGDLRPRDTVAGCDLFAIATGEAMDVIEGDWRGTARGVNHVFTGKVRIACAQETGQALSWGRERHADEADESAS